MSARSLPTIRSFQPPRNVLLVDDGAEPSASGPTADGTWRVPVNTSAEPPLTTVKMRSCRPACVDQGAPSE